ncbi:hypothetical protein X975_04649, partial [Stegodyphus mimosarum]
MKPLVHFAHDSILRGKIVFSFVRRPWNPQFVFSWLSG